jgi:IclR family acetate operon transcriptional repressor
VVIDSTEARQSLYPLRAVDRVCDIIDLLADNPAGVTLSFLAGTLALPKSSAFRYLAALEVRGYVLRAPDSVGYVLGSPLAGHALPSGSLTERLVGVARPLMARLITPHAPICVLFTLDGASVRCLWVASSLNDDRITRVGEHEMLHNTAVGKAIAAQLSDETVLSLLAAAGMDQPTTSTIGSPTALLRELHLIRGEGFAVSDSERHPDVRGVAVPIGGHTVSIGLAGAGDELTPDRIGAAVRRLRRAASALSREVRS